MSETATFRIWRGEAGQGEYQDYTTELWQGMVILDAVREIQAEQAPDLAVRWNCKAGKCGSCSAEVNGMPMRAFPNVRDLVTDVSWNYEVKKRIRRFKPRAPDQADGTWAVKQRDADRIMEFRKCIECFLCQDVCHVLREHRKHDEFIGPRFLTYAAGLELHPIDSEDRLQDLRTEHGIGYCNITRCCTKVCPEGIQITDNAIIPLKERVVDQSYDPVRKLVQIFRKKPAKE
jgi:succinate dehydrogenase / fumarate reductase iron-sulfur subunit